MQTGFDIRPYMNDELNAFILFSPKVGDRARLWNSRPRLSPQSIP
jgi:hypothetical protein